MYQTHLTTTCTACQSRDKEIARLREKNHRLSWNGTLNMYRAAGIEDQIADLPTDETYTVVVCDIDRMKAINEATQNHFQTDRYLRGGLAVRGGEIAGQMHEKGDEFIFIIAEHSRGEVHAMVERNAHAFVARIARQLAGQALTSAERAALAAAQGVTVDQARLSATFATHSGVRAGQVPSIIERLSCDVLAQKAQRDARVKVTV